MFRPYKVILISLQEDRSEICLCFIPLWAMKHNSWICLLGGPEDDLIGSKHVALTKHTIFVYKIKCFVID